MKKLTASAVTLIAITSLAAAGPAFAAGKHHKLTYEQAWAHCKALLDQEKTPGDLSGHWRTYRGTACMHKYGYRI